MRIKKFDDFLVSNMDESFDYYGGRYGGGGSFYSGGRYSDSGEGNTKFSRWLRSLSADMKSKHSELITPSEDPRPDSGAMSLKRSQSLLPLLGRLIFGGGAAIADFFTPKRKGDKVGKIDKSDLVTKKKDFLDSWERENLSGKSVTNKDAEDFYSSGVLKGKQYFGSGFDPQSPKNKDEKYYSDYLGDAMHRYYNRLYK